MAAKDIVVAFEKEYEMSFHTNQDCARDFTNGWCKMKWTNVNELTPIDGETVDVITLCADYNLINGRWTDVKYENGSWYSVCLPNIKIIGVTHWMYPPSAPREIMKEILTYRNDDGSTFIREFECDLGCDGCETNDHCYVDDEIPGLRGGCPLVASNLVSRAPKGN